MSTIQVLPPAAFNAGVRPRQLARPAGLRLTMRGRVVFGLVFLWGLMLLMFAVGGAATATKESGPEPSVRYVSVTEGQTLYEIAGGYAAPGGVNEMVAEIRDLNSLPNSNLSVGQRIAIPMK